jgi:hypothetical protein
VHVALPAEAYNPGEQVTQDAAELAPVDADADPAGQLRQAVAALAPTLVEYVPAPQLVQLVDCAMGA